MKKVWGMLLAAVLTVGMLAGCSSQGSGGDAGEGGEPKGEITVWGWNVAASSMELAVEKFNEKYPDVKVKVQDIGRLDLYDKLTVGLAANGAGLPDVLMVESDRLDNYKKQFPNGFMDLSAKGYDKYEDKFGKSKIATAKNEDGKFVAMPWDIGPTGVFYRTDLFEKAGVDPKSIETWDEFLEAGKVIKEKTGAALGPIDIAKDDALYRMMLNQQGAFYFDEEGKIDMQSDESVKAMSMIQKMHQNELVANVDGWDGTVTATVNGTVATVPFGVWYTGTIMEQAKDLEGKWDVMPLPAFEKGGNRNANLGGSDIVIPAASKNKDAAYAFAEFFTTDKAVQVEVLKKYGIFPSLLETYEDSYFDEPVPFFNNQPIFRMFADEVENIPAANYTNDYPRGLKYAADAQAAALLDKKDPAEALKSAAEQLANESKREINK
ncbi:extracellular solute-binding protein [Bacillus mangrovi]|uniref:Extracellular solute-binding protein n=1 Tax=Metabacillus mangrovi TaxID=1491830 RepID=A0A7X2S6K4_9BACI|nr:sugar ABC transporter substrate-binding protein [Metabacillus mangrovi]MTH54609.1 extracellular solute-binding protein [Metabacillus mangrovi]